MPFDPSVDPAVVGANISFSRKKANRTQEELARAIDISRPTLIAIESGQRAPTEQQLSAIADELGASLHDLLSLGVPDEAIAVRFRALRGAKESQAALESLEDFGRRYAKLEQLAGDRIRRREPVPLPIDKVSNLERVAEELAATERLRLGLGDGPLPDLRSILEEDAGIRIFGLDELRKTKISGIFAYSRQYGALIGFNSAHDSRRIRWTLCHEYAHFLTERYEPEVTVSGEARMRRDRREVFADAFAARFLMPSSGLSRRFSDMARDAGEIKVAHLLILAHLFEVSFQAITQRLEEIGRVNRGTYEFLKKQGFKPKEAEAMLDLNERRIFDKLPSRYVYLVAELYSRGELSEGDVAHYFHTDRLHARDILSRVSEKLSPDSQTLPSLSTPIEVSN